MIELTVIIPSYNMQAGAVRAITSVLAQEIPVAVILVDDCSQPAITLPPAMADNSAITLIRHDTQKGASAARNTGVRSCATPWLSFLDSDDVLLPNTLKARLDIAKQTLAKGTIDPVNTLFGCGWVEPEHNGRAARIRTPRGASTPAQFASGCWYNPGSCIIARHEVYRDRPFDESLSRMEDLHWGIAFGLSGGQLLVGGPAGVEVLPSNQANLQAVEKSAAAIQRGYASLKFDCPDVWLTLNAYLNYEMTSYAAREGKYLKAAMRMVRSLMWVPRFHRHLSPGWDYEPLNE